MSNLSHILGGALLLALAVSCSPARSNAGPAAPSLVPKVTGCKVSDQISYGAWTPSVDDAVAAIRALPDYCVNPAVAEPAVRACAAQLGKTTMTLEVTFSDHTCWESIVPAEWNGRRWIAGHYTNEHEGQFDGSGAAVELRGGRTTLVLENFGLVSSCKAPGPMPVSAPPDFASYPPDLAQALCGFGK